MRLGKKMCGVKTVTSPKILLLMIIVATITIITYENYMKNYKEPSFKPFNVNMINPQLPTIHNIDHQFWLKKEMPLDIRQSNDWLVVDHGFLIYSVYYDNRTFDSNSLRPNIPHVVIIAAGRYPLIPVTIKIWQDIDNLMSVLSYDNVTVISSGMMGSENLKMILLVHCPLAGNSSIPKYVSVHVKTTHGEDVSPFIEVKLPPKPEQKKKLLLCLKAYYISDFKRDSFYAKDMIEWVEFYKILGVDHIDIYVYSIVNSLLPVLEKYAKEGYMTVYSRSPYPNDSLAKLPCRLIRLHDSMYRNMHAYQMLINFDLDEFIMPRATNNIVELLKSITGADKNFTNNQYIFLNQVHFTDYPQQNTSVLKTVSNTYASEPTRKCHKSIFNIENCAKANSHACAATFKTQLRINVKAEDAVMSHYKTCKYARQDFAKNCTLHFTEVQKDETALKFSDRLLPNVEEALRSFAMEV